MKLTEVPNLNYACAMLMIEELIRNGVECFCIAPGSRSSALTAAVALQEREKRLKRVIHFDERGLAFFALGYVSVTKKPAVLICSSGTAVANFFPAIIETSKKKLPLIVLTADRPPELQHTGALQTIDQEKIYEGYVRWQTTLPAPDMNIKPEVLLTTIDQAVFLSQNPMPGPVHLNCMFREPLAPTKTSFNAIEYLKSVKGWLNAKRDDSNLMNVFKNRNGVNASSETGKNGVYTRYSTGAPVSDFSGDEEVISILKNTKRGVIAVGKLRNKEESQLVLRLAEKLQWPVFPDIVSGLRSVPHKNIIHYYDMVLLSDKFSPEFEIDTILHVGGRITSKRYYQFVEKCRPKHYISVLGHSLRNDPLHVVSIRLKSRVSDFASSMIKVLDRSDEKHTFNASPDFLNFLKEASEKSGEVIEHFTHNLENVSEIGVARRISELMPEEHGLFLSNSMPVRDMDMFAVTDGKQIEIGGNRGASGIDGIIASACGFNNALNSRTTLLIGDLAFLHDLNSLAMIKYTSKPMIIVVPNNDGGGIFSFLPIADVQDIPEFSKIFDSYFATPQGLNFKNAASMFGLNYMAPQTMNDFETAYRTALTSDKSSIIEVKTNRNNNVREHRELQSQIKSAIDKKE